MSLELLSNFAHVSWLTEGLGISIPNRVTFSVPQNYFSTPMQFF